MDQDKQTLLEAAKAMLDPSLPLGEYPWDNLRAAISREEAKPADFWQTARWNRDDSERLSIALAALREEHAKFCREVFSGAHAKELRERAEKAEAESARLSAELAKEREARSAFHAMVAAHMRDQGLLSKGDTSYAAVDADLAAVVRGFRRNVASVDRVIPWVGGHLSEHVALVCDEALRNRQRAEKAEAELVRERSFKDSFKRDAGDVRKDLRDFNTRLAEVVPMSENPIDTARKVVEEVHTLREHLKKAEAELAKAKSDTRAKIQSELRSIERALCSADVLNKFAGLSRGAYSCHVHNTIETAIGALRDDAATPPYLPPFEGDPKACAFTHGAFSSPSDSRPSPEAPLATRWGETICGMCNAPRATATPGCPVRNAMLSRATDETFPKITAESIAEGEAAVRDGKWINLDQLRQSIAEEAARERKVHGGGPRVNQGFQP